MLQQLSALNANGQKQICRPYYPNQLRLYNLGVQLRQGKFVTPAHTDKFKVLHLHVDKNPDFDWPFTYAMPDGTFRYVLINEFHHGVTVLPHMQPFVEWVALADFNPYQYEQVVGGRLSVTGAWHDLSRGLAFDYEMLPYISAHALSCDTHPVLDASFDRERFVARRKEVVMPGTSSEYTVERGEHPRAFTVILLKDVWHATNNKDGLWWPVRNQEGTYDYIKELEASGQMAHVTWWKHNTRLTFGAGIEPVVWENIMLHSYARDIEPIIFFKGLTDPEFFGIFGPQVVIKGDKHAQVNLKGLQMYTLFDMVVLDGEADTHCLKNTAMQMAAEIGAKDPDQMSKLVIASDGTSGIPGFEDLAKADYAKLEAQGLRRMTYEQIGDEIRSKAS